MTVRDHGIGLPPDALPFVFDRFWQADGSSSRAFGGLGLGLSLVRHIVEAHGGDVSAGSEGLGQGSTFTVRIPISAARPIAAPPQANRITPKLDGLCVLLVEDETDIRDWLGAVLEHHGARVVACDSASSALEAMSNSKFDVLVSDIGMPHEDGFSLIRRVRALSADHGGQVPAAALSGFTRPEDMRRALAAGYQMHVAKPIEPSELVIVVASLAHSKPDAAAADPKSGAQNLH